MSTPQAAQSGNTPNSGKPTQVRRPRNADPLVRKPNRQRERRPPPTNLQRKTNGVLDPSENKNAALAAASSQPSSSSTANGTASTEPPKSNVVSEFPLYTTKRALKEGLRYHVARFHSKKKIDLVDDQEFTRPVRLHRRDPRAPPGGAGAKHDAAPETKEEILDSKERERQDIMKQEKEAQKQAELAQIAPNVNQPGGQSKRPTAFQKKTQQVYRSNATPEQQKQNKLRYEEALPWHLEDFDNKNVWVASYEEALSEVHAGLLIGQDSFHLVPVEKWYKFKPTNLFPKLTLEEAEALQKRKGKEPRWVMESQSADKAKQEEDRNRKISSKLFLGKWEGGAAGRPSVTNMKSEFADADELDFDDGVDDDEGDGDLGGDEEDVKQAETKIKREQRNANFFDMNDERDVDKEEEQTKREKVRAKKLSKGVRKALVKREKNDDYDTSDSERNPYSSESESEDTDEEIRKEDERKKAEEKAEKEKVKPKDATKPPSGASSKGTNTPSGRNKHSDPLKKTSASLKRAGSPNLSEASGNESTRKKHKKKHVSSSSQATGTSTPIPGSRQMSPAAEPSSSSSSRPSQQQSSSQQGPSRKSSIVKLPIEPARLTEISSAAPRPDKNHKRARREMSGSDGDDVAGSGSGGETKKKIKLKFSGSPRGGSPQGSRAGSPSSSSQALPTPASTNTQPKDSSNKKKKATTSKPGAAASPPPTGPMVLPTETELLAEIPPEGISVTALVTKFRSRNVPMPVWKQMLDKAADYGPDRLLRPKKKAT
ncbi:MAG: Pre-mRNA-splicing factor cwc26 [Chaenotheca gracillima]|nr:MAG: Pre-mRNA-splicing factor cwc26 [Chaenotheca gracillima]